MPIGCATSITGGYGYTSNLYRALILNYPTGSAIGSSASTTVDRGTGHLNGPLLSFPPLPARRPQTSFEAEDNINVRLRSGTGGSASYGGLKPGSMLGNLLQVRWRD